MVITFLTSTLLQSEVVLSNLFCYSSTSCSDFQHRFATLACLGVESRRFMDLPPVAAATEHLSIGSVLFLPHRLFDWSTAPASTFHHIDWTTETLRVNTCRPTEVWPLAGRRENYFDRNVVCLFVKINATVKLSNAWIYFLWQSLPWFSMVISKAFKTK